MSLDFALTAYFFEVLYNIVLPFTPRSTCALWLLNITTVTIRSRDDDDDDDDDDDI
jgi:hypothetical protein